MVWHKDSAGRTGGVNASPPDIQTTFPDQRLITFAGNGSIVQYQGNTDPLPVAHEDLYDA